MRTRIIFAFCYLFIASTSYTQSRIEVAGSIVLNDNKSTNPKPGSIKWTGSDFHGWNGKNWISLTSGVAYYGQITDVDGNTYPTIKINDREWMAENLRTTKYNDGSPIAHIPDSSDWSDAGTGAWCWYDNNASHNQPYGKLYNWYAVSDSRRLCPSGWHVPSEAHWNAMKDYLGEMAANKLREEGFAHWLSPNQNASNSSGFSAVGSGLRYGNGKFNRIKHSAYYWSRTTFSDQSAHFRIVYFDYPELQHSNTSKFVGFSVRCVQD